MSMTFEAHWPPGPIQVMVPVTITPAAAPESLAAHIAAESPHPAYDDMPSLTLQFENGLI